MTQDNPPVEVTPEDREAAVDFSTRYLYPNSSGVRSALAQAFARHRLASQRPAVGDEVERVARAIYEEDDVWSVAFKWPDTDNPSDADVYRRLAKAAIAAMQPQAPVVSHEADNPRDNWACLSSATGDVGELVEVHEVETVTVWPPGEPGEPFWRIEINGYCADFDHKDAAENFAREINAKLTELQALIQRSDSAR